MDDNRRTKDVRIALRSFHLLDVWHHPGLLEERLLRAVETKPREPPLPCGTLNPVRLRAGNLRADVDVHRPIGVLAQLFVQ
jgi:hypothetical protein